ASGNRHSFAICASSLTFLPFLVGLPRILADRMRHMDVDQLPYLETFAKAAELSSFTAAAHALGLTQAAVSQRIQALERELGTPLFRRAGGKVLLTDAGRRLHPLAEQILSLHQEARGKVTGKKSP